MKNEKNIPATTPSNAGKPARVDDSGMDRLARLRKERSEALAKIRKLQGRNLSLQKKAEQRKRFLVGEAYLNANAKPCQVEAYVTGLLDAMLKRDQDRALFGLSPKPATPPSPASQPVSPTPPATPLPKPASTVEPLTKPATLPPTKPKNPTSAAPVAPVPKAATPPSVNNTDQPPQTASGQMSVPQPKATS